METYPNVVPVLQGIGMGCLGCPSATAEPLWQAAEIHGFNVYDLVEKLETDEKELNMSAFLGHIHYWLYRKIQLLVERENLIVEKTAKVVDDLAEELHSISVDTYGEPINPSIPLENIIDHGNIHGWLANQINIASVREAAFIRDLLDTNSGDEAVNVVTAILDAFAVQGQAWVVAQDNLEEHTAPRFTMRCKTST